MNLTFGAGRDHQVAACCLGLTDPLDLKRLAVAVTSGPGGISAAEAAGAPVGHFRKPIGFKPVDQFAGKVGPVFKSAEPAGILKRHLMMKFLKPDRPLGDFLLQEIIEMDDFKIQFDARGRILP